MNYQSDWCVWEKAELHQQMSDARDLAAYLYAVSAFALRLIGGIIVQTNGDWS